MGRKTGFESTPEYDHYIHSQEWREKANRRLSMDNHTCIVCGKRATEVHHMTYEHFGNEPMSDLISLCHECHEEAENIYDPTITPSAMNLSKDKCNFMAALRIDTNNIVPMIFDYLIKVNGSDFESLLRFRQPPDGRPVHSWRVLKKSVEALCRKRYEFTCAADRREIAISAISNHAVEVCLAEIEHALRNDIQGSLRDSVIGMHEAGETYKEIAKETGLSEKTIGKLKNDAGDSFGPSAREEVLYYCGLDAAAGIRPEKGFRCLTEEDYNMLNTFADYEASISGDGQFLGEYWNS